MGGEGAECRLLLQEFCWTGNARSGAGGGEDGRRAKGIFSWKRCISVEGELWSNRKEGKQLRRSLLR